MIRRNTLFSILIFIVAYFITGCGEDNVSQCELEPNPGTCLAVIPKYYFDQTEQACKEFIWGGCGGVVPFDTYRECLECYGNNPTPCELQPDAGPCQAVITRYYYDSIKDSCMSFIWGGCGGVVPFETVGECKLCVIQ